MIFGGRPVRSSAYPCFIIPSHGSDGDPSRAGDDHPPGLARFGTVLPLVDTLARLQAGRFTIEVWGSKTTPRRVTSGFTLRARTG
jgi:hypothetical protein